MTQQTPTNASPAEIPFTGWALATVLTADGPTACLETSSGLYRLQPSLARVGLEGVDATIDLFFEKDFDAEVLNRAAEAVQEEDKVDDYQSRLAPLLYPGKIVCAGANYFDHLEEMGIQGATKENQRLFFFTKPARQAVVGEGDTVHMPFDTHKFDWEVELATVIGRTARAVSAKDAMDYVAGYTVAIDFSARDNNMAPDTFYKLDWFAGKANDTNCPLGPRMIPAQSVANPQDFNLKLWVNGELKQNGNASNMVFPIAEQIEILSRITTLEPGDILLTGTPAGVGMPKNTFLSVGDRVDAEIGGIGKFSVTIQEPR